MRYAIRDLNSPSIEGNIIDWYSERSEKGHSSEWSFQMRSQLEAGEGAGWIDTFSLSIF